MGLDLRIRDRLGTEPVDRKGLIDCPPHDGYHIRLWTLVHGDDSKGNEMCLYIYHGHGLMRI